MRERLSTSSNSQLTKNNIVQTCVAVVNFTDATFYIIDIFNVFFSGIFRFNNVNVHKIHIWIINYIFDMLFVKCQFKNCREFEICDFV